ncbi:MAG: undecaprenyl-diphosphate phosphatase [Cardiobacteriaceae bacterium]|nr:undecaprenyl-diphosphate phosphatase [Cardiobacteriaceae bacterium]
MSWFEAVVLALVQGVTEFLPVSSSAHLLLVPFLFGWADQGLAFDVAVHLGTLVAVVSYFWKDIKPMIYHGLQTLTPRPAPDPEGYGRLAWGVVIATLPIGMLGLLLSDVVENHLRSVLVLALATMVFGVLLGWAEKRSQNNAAQKGLRYLTWQSALGFGFAQCLAMIPGTSRSGITLTAGLWLGFDKESAAKFSFLMSIPTILLAGLLHTVKLAKSDLPVDWGAMGIGILVSMVAGYLCIRLFMQALAKIPLMVYVYYRLGLGLVLLWLYYR